MQDKKLRGYIVEKEEVYLFHIALGKNNSVTSQALTGAFPKYVILV
jgi:hypothetical protein